jgi:hypothetical protein
MKSAILLAFYLGDQMISGIMPFSSGPFSIAAVLICWRRSNPTSKMRLYPLIAATILLASGFLGAQFSGTTAGAFFVATTMMLTLMWTIGAGLRPGADVLITSRMAFIGVCIATAFMTLSLLGWDAQTMILKIPTNRGAGLFIEPSHYALFVMPLWLLAYQERRYRLVLYAALVFFFLTCFSATLVAFVVITLCFSLFITNASQGWGWLRVGRRLVAVSTVVVVGYYATIPVNVVGMPLHYYIGDRINGILNAGDPVSTNLSSLVVLQGVELAHISLVESRGFGVGLGNFGLSEKIVNQSDFRSTINAVAYGMDLNLRDGGLMANKLIGELGLFSLLIPVSLCLYLVRIKRMRDFRSQRYHAAFAVALICLLFVRVLPNFSGPACLALFSLAGVLQGRRSAKTSCLDPEERQRIKNPARLASVPGNS